MIGEEIIIGILTLLSVSIMIIAAIGIIRLPGALARQHAATKAATLSVGLFSIALIAHAVISEWSLEWIVKPIMLMVILLITLPLAAHALGRSALKEKKAGEAGMKSSKNAM